jgi:pimeloyl-ACP methyl ester carboxylesterase
MTARFVPLRDGRRLAYAEFGDPQGWPVLYCHGFPSSRREASLLHRGAEHLGVRVVAPDRPGFGDSDFQPRRRINDWPADIAALADHLGLSTFALLGVSGGAPFALACAAAIPERLQGLALVCPLGPIYEARILSQMRLPVRLNFEAALYTPSFVRSFYGGLTSTLLFHWPQLVEGLVRDVACSPSDRQALSDPQVSAVLTETVRDAMKNHALGALQDLDLYVRPWQIDFTQIQIPVTLWHGEKDAMVPIEHARWYARVLPHAQTRFLADEGHYSLPLFHTEPILESLFSASAHRP